VVLVIEDAGKGFSSIGGERGFIGSSRSRRRSKGVGLASMSERMRQIGGTFDIESGFGRTIVRAIAALPE
jgi:signal transduction histidine kinase